MLLGGLFAGSFESMHRLTTIIQERFLWHRPKDGLKLCVEIQECVTTLRVICTDTQRPRRGSNNRSRSHDSPIMIHCLP